MLLLTDGSVLVHDEPNSGAVSGSNRWYRLAPDSTGSYSAGTWTQLTNGPNSPLYFACNVLRDGRVFIAGGEFNGTSTQAELAAAEVYDPTTNAWTSVGAPTGWTQIGDAPSVVLPDGRVLVGAINTNNTAVFDPTTNTWSAGPNKSDPRSTEETWVLLPDQTVLAIECDARPATEKYVIAANTWVTAGSTPVALVDAPSEEVGAAILLPDGRVLAIGATANTALYTPPVVANQPGTWAAGPTFPVLVTNNVTGAKDAPACLLPNGKVLCVVGPYMDTAASNTAAFWGTPVSCFEFDPSNDSLTQVTAPVNNGGSPFSSRLMLLPDGTVLHTNGSNTIAQYTPDLAPDPVWRPTITSVPTGIRPGHSYTLKGRQLNGLSQAVIYGDEGAMATNYPIVRLTHVGTGIVTYCRTHDHSTMGVQTGAVIHSTTFDVPSGTPLGASQLTVIANGIASDPTMVSVGIVKYHKELKFEIKEKLEIKEHHLENVKQLFEDLRKISEVFDPQVVNDEPGWIAVVRQLAERSDALEAEVRQLRTFVHKGERPPVEPHVEKVTFDRALLGKVDHEVERERRLDGMPPGGRRGKKR